ncbi:MAG: glycosyltransferase family 2 protein [Sumerlaeia bacterium]
MSSLNSPSPELSIVVPIYNEVENLPVLHSRVQAVCEKLGMSYELVLVDDGSSDGSWELIEALHGENDRVVGVRLSRNFGHQVCLTAGLELCRGELVVMMDADLQDPPELIPKLIAKQREGFDIVYAVRSERRGESFFKKATAALFYRVLRRLTAINIPMDTGDFRLITRQALNSLLSIRERSRFLRGLFSWVGYRSVGVPYKRAARHKGETKYPLRKMLHLAKDGITSFSTIPLQLATYMGFLASFVGFFYGLSVLRNWYMGSTVQGWASLAIITLFFGGIQLFTLGILGEYVGRIFEEVKQRPLYFTREVLRSGEKEQTVANAKKRSARKKLSS